MLAQVAAGALDLALITDFEGLKGLELLREEPLVWVAAERFPVEEGTPIPLALGSADLLAGGARPSRRWSRRPA